MNDSCYTFEKIEYKQGLLSECVDATYVIHLEGNGRLEAVKTQLAEYCPTRLVYIVLNKGYKKCEKPEYVKNPARDLVDANLQIFKHAEQQGYGNILVLEDDFIFSEKIKERRHCDNVCRFLRTHTNKPICYLLGCIPFILVPYDYNNYRQLYSFATHCVVFNKKMRDIVLNENPEKILDWDAYFYFSHFNRKRVYYDCLCYQLFQETENSKFWGQEYGPIIQNLCKTTIPIMKALNMDKNPEPGFTVFYIFSKMLGLLLLFLLLWICYKVVYFAYKNIKFVKRNIKRMVK